MKRFRQLTHILERPSLTRSVTCLLVLLACACRQGNAGEPASTPDTATELPVLAVRSAAFEEGAPIPARFTCEGENLSPPLGWSKPPEGTRSLALICDDPDAPMSTWVHWVLYNLDAATDTLDAGVPTGAALGTGAMQGITDFRTPGYGGPCPPHGRPHRYVFKLYALDTLLELEGTVRKDALVEAMSGHVLAVGRLTGTYQR
jgi:Raf kinase inhibitor-like YbhB/YbcL family protein